MKLKLYRIKSTKPETENEYWDICDLANVPSLKFGTYDQAFLIEDDHTKTSIKNKGFKILDNGYKPLLKTETGFVKLCGFMLVGSDGMKYLAA